MRQRAMVLVAVLVVTALVTMIALGLMFRVRAEVAASAARRRGEQAYAAAVSGLFFTAGVLQRYSQDADVWYDDPDLFQNQAVADDGANVWYFTVWGDDPASPDTVRFGASDEAAKLNLNTAPEETWLVLEVLANDLVDSLMDYRDADSDVRAEGAEQEYYDGLAHPYVIPNGPLTTVEELFLVKGFTAAVVYGEDANFNGRLDPNEDDGDDHFPPDNRDGRLDVGLRALTTVHTWEPNVDRSGRSRFDLNSGPPPSGLGLPAETRRFVEIYLAEGNRFRHPSELLEARYEVKQRHRNYADLAPGAEIESGVEADELPVVLDRLTAGPEGRPDRLAGLVNINTARADVLAALPGLDPNLAQEIVDVRGSLDAETRASTAWLYTQNLLDADAFKRVAPYVTARSYQFSVRCVGFGVPCGRFRVLEAVLDLAGDVPRIAYLRDITRLGLPLALDPEFVERSKR